jgi:hypothetical protein
VWATALRTGCCAYNINSSFGLLYFLNLVFLFLKPHPVRAFSCDLPLGYFEVFSSDVYLNTHRLSSLVTVAQGVPLDDSDAEWDDHVEEEYGPGWRNTLWPDQVTLDSRLDMADLVHHAFHHYNENVVFHGQVFNSRLPADPAPTRSEVRDCANGVSPPREPPEWPPSPFSQEPGIQADILPDGPRGGEDIPHQPCDGDAKEAALEDDDLNLPP